VTAPGPTRPLHKDDLADLRGSELSDGTIGAMGCRSIDKAKVRELTGVKVSCGGYAIPYPGLWDQTGGPYLRIRLREPHNGMKYVSGKGDDPQLYIPPGFTDLPQGDLLVVTEGEKKAAKAVQEGIPCVGIQGVFSWSDPGTRAVEKCNGDRVSADTAPLPALLELARKYKRVLVLGDSDTASNPQSQKALRLLVISLCKRGVRAAFAACPPPNNNKEGASTKKKQGLDDWLVAGRFMAKRSLEALFYCGEIAFVGINDDYNAREFAEAATDKLAFSRADWKQWTGVYWTPDTTNHRLPMVPRIGDHYRDMAERLHNLQSSVTTAWKGIARTSWPEEVLRWVVPVEAAVKELRDAACKIGNLHGVKAAIALAQHRLSVQDDAWDRDPCQLAVENGVIDLRTGSLLPPCPKQYISKCAGTNYDPTASASKFLKFLERVQPLPEVRDYLQRLAGYCAIGNSDAQKFIIFFGSGRNGKGTFIRLLMHALNGYALKAPASMLAEQRPDQPRNDVARLVGARFVSLSETSKNLRIDEALVKSMTGQDLQCARFLNHEFFEFMPCFTPIVDTNFPPQFREKGPAIRSRVVFIPWSVRIPESEENKELTAELLGEELPGILNWIVQGAKAYIERGLTAPAAIVDVTESLLGQRNDFDRWSESCIEEGPDFSVQSSILYDNYRSWSKAEGVSELVPIQEWSKRLEQERGLHKEKRNHGLQTWIGIRVREQHLDSHRFEQAGAPVTSSSPLTMVTPTLTADASLVSSPPYMPIPAELQQMPGGGRLV
jgi:P4 family phage/plasmid primase-like protien